MNADKWLDIVSLARYEHYGFSASSYYWHELADHKGEDDPKGWDELTEKEQCAVEDAFAVYLTDQGIEPADEDCYAEEPVRWWAPCEVGY